MTLLTVRFGVGTADGPQSTIWTAWANKRRSDLYLSARNFAGISKISFHESGDWRDANSDELAAPFVGPGASRVSQRWRREENLGLPGLTHGFDVIIPAEEVVRPIGLEPTTKPVIYRPIPSARHATYFSLVWASPTAGDQGAAPAPANAIDPVAIAQFDMPNGDRIWIVAYDVEIDAQRVAELAAYKRAALAMWAEISAEPPINKRAGMYGYLPNGSRRVVEMALDVPPTVYE